MHTRYYKLFIAVYTHSLLCIHRPTKQRIIFGICLGAYCWQEQQVIDHRREGVYNELANQMPILAIVLGYATEGLLQSHI
jgi:anthranilate/para-aminobenzoate synthase component II